MLRDLPTRVLLLVGFLLAALAPVMIVALIAYSSGQDALRGQALRQLESARDGKRAQVERFFAERVGNAEVMARDPYLALALDELCAAMREAGGASSAAFAGEDAGRFRAPAAYRAVHDRHHDFLRTFAERHHFYDLLLADAEGGTVCYSVLKERDFASPAPSQPSLGEAWAEARAGRVVLSDTRPYPPSANAAAQFVAAPVYRDGRKRGVLVMQISVEAIDAFMRERSGIGETEEMLLVGTDRRMRSDSRLDPARTVEASFRGEVARNGVDTEAVRRALAGEVGVGQVVDPHGRPSLAAWAPADLLGTRWALVTSVEAAEIEQKIGAALDHKMLWALLASLVAAVITALLLSSFIGRGIGTISERVASLGEEVRGGSLSARGDPATVAVDFRGVLHQVNGLIETMQRVTDEKLRLEERVSHMQRIEAIGTLAGGFAHDFNNILTYLHAYADIIREATPAASPTMPHLDQLVSGLDRAAEVVQRILTFSRDVKREPRPMDLGPVVADAVGLVRAALPGNIRVETELPERPHPVRADPTALHQVAVNLLTNALHAMQPRGGVLRVAVQERTVEASGSGTGPGPGHYVVLRVADTGCGMDQATLARIFEPYFTTKPVGQGSGMGLALAHGVVTSAGGTILVDSVPQQGSVFEVWLPRLESGATLAPAPVSAGARLARVLFVDDEGHICRVGRHLLESLGYEVVTQTSARAALEVLRDASEPFDCLITDLAMPEMTGLELAARALAARPGLFVIAATGHQGCVGREALAESGISELLAKPYRKSDLARALAARPPRASGA